MKELKINLAALSKVGPASIFRSKADAEQCMKNHRNIIGAQNNPLPGYLQPAIMVSGLMVMDTYQAYEKNQLDDLDFYRIPEGWVVTIQYEAFDGETDWSEKRRLDQFLKMYPVLESIINVPAE